MLERARQAVRQARSAERVTVERGDSTVLSDADGRLDQVLAGAVTMFVDGLRAARELMRVCRPGGLVLTTEFLWRRPPAPEVRSAFLGDLCLGMTFGTQEDWLQIYRDAWLAEIEVTSGAFAMMTPAGFVRDEGLMNTARVMGTAMTRPVYLRCLTWMRRRMRRAVPELGYLALCGRKPA